MKLTKIALVCALAAIVAGCGHKLPGSASGLSDVFKAPPHEIRGATPTDQAWIDETVAVGQGCCGWQIKPRPPELDRPPPVTIKPPPKKKSLWKKLTS